MWMWWLSPSDSWRVLRKANAATWFACSTVGKQSACNCCLNHFMKNHLSVASFFIITSFLPWQQPCLKPVLAKFITLANFSDWYQSVFWNQGHWNKQVPMDLCQFWIGTQISSLASHSSLQSWPWLHSHPSPVLSAIVVIRLWHPQPSSFFMHMHVPEEMVPGVSSGKEAFRTK